MGDFVFMRAFLSIILIASLCLPPLPARAASLEQGLFSCVSEHGLDCYAQIRSGQRADLELQLTGALSIHNPKEELKKTREMLRKLKVFALYRTAELSIPLVNGRQTAGSRENLELGRRERNRTLNNFLNNNDLDLDLRGGSIKMQRRLNELDKAWDDFTTSSPAFCRSLDECIGQDNGQPGKIEEHFLNACDPIAVDWPVNNCRKTVTNNLNILRSAAQIEFEEREQTQETVKNMAVITAPVQSVAPFVSGTEAKKEDAPLAADDLRLAAPPTGSTPEAPPMLNMASYHATGDFNRQVAQTNHNDSSRTYSAAANMIRRNQAAANLREEAKTAEIPTSDSLNGIPPPSPQNNGSMSAAGAFFTGLGAAAALAVVMGGIGGNSDPGVGQARGG